jgi:hypothetical protein
MHMLRARRRLSVVLGRSKIFAESKYVLALVVLLVLPRLDWHS